VSLPDGNGTSRRYRRHEASTRAERPNGRRAAWREADQIGGSRPAFEGTETRMPAVEAGDRRHRPAPAGASGPRRWRIEAGARRVARPGVNSIPVIHPIHRRKHARGAREPAMMAR
jgi:hypothetical protein